MSDMDNDMPATPGTVLGYLPGFESGNCWFVNDHADQIYVKSWNAATHDADLLQERDGHTPPMEVVAICRLDGTPAARERPQRPVEPDILDAMDIVINHLPTGTMRANLGVMRDAIIVRRGKAQAWDEGFEARENWTPSSVRGQPHDPPTNPYED
jgi:hypothetical protein